MTHYLINICKEDLFLPDFLVIFRKYFLRTVILLSGLIRFQPHTGVLSVAKSFRVKNMVIKVMFPVYAKTINNVIILCGLLSTLLYELICWFPYRINSSICKWPLKETSYLFFLLQMYEWLIAIVCYQLYWFGYYISFAIERNFF